MQSDREIVADALVRIQCDGSGSGVAVVTQNGLRILSCYHVVQGHKQATVICREQAEGGPYIFSEFPATVEKINKKHDLALLALPEGIDVQLKPLEIAKKEPGLYETVLTGGCPNKLFGVVIEGWLQGLNGSAGDEAPNDNGEYLFSGLSVSGSSGGALVNMEHELVGIISAFTKDDEQNIYSLGIATPLKAIRRFLGVGARKHRHLRSVKMTVDFKPDFELSSRDEVDKSEWATCHEFVESIWEAQDDTGREKQECRQCGNDRNHPIHLGSSE